MGSIKFEAFRELTSVRWCNSATDWTNHSNQWDRSRRDEGRSKEVTRMEFERTLPNNNEKS